MSIKIYNGFKTSITDVKQLNEILAQIKKETDLIFHHKFASAIFKLFFYYIDLKNCARDLFYSELKIFFKKFPIKAIDFLDLYNIYMFCLFRLNDVFTTRIRDVEIDILLEITFFPIEDIVLINASYENDKKIYQILSNFFKPYYYWDNTDKPKNISQKEWQKRREHWLKTDKIQPLYWINYNVLLHEPPLSYQELLNLYDQCKPTKEDRAKKIALRQLDEMYAHEYNGKFSYSNWEKFMKNKKNLFLELIQKNQEKIQEYSLKEIANLKIR